MPLFLVIGLIILGFIFLIYGAEWLVSGASAVARKYGIPELVIGLTIVAFGTSAPDLVVNIVAAFEAHDDIVLGNIIGSNNVNLFLILGVAGLIYPIKVTSATAWRQIPVSFFITLLFVGLANDFYTSHAPMISWIDGTIFLFLFAGFFYYIYLQVKHEQVPEVLEEIPQIFEELPEATEPVSPTTPVWIYILLGLTGLILGGKMVVDYGVILARDLGISEKIIGLTILAGGTSLPELVTAIVAALKKKSDLVIGNVIGSNIFNLLLVLGISSVIHPLKFDSSLNVEIYLLSGGTLFLFLSMLTGKRKNLDRWEAGVLVGAYVIYLVWLMG